MLFLNVIPTLYDRFNFSLDNKSEWFEPRPREGESFMERMGQIDDLMLTSGAETGSYQQNVNE